MLCFFYILWNNSCFFLFFCIDLFLICFSNGNTMKLALRKKNISGNRQSLYLDIYDNGKRYYEYLNLYLEPEKRTDKTTKSKNKEILELAHKIKAKRETELANASNGFIAKSKSKTNFITFIKKYSETKSANTKRSYLQCIHYLEKFKGTDISFQSISKDFLQNFISYLHEEHLKPSTISIYLAKIKAVINQALKDKIIIDNPFLSISLPKRTKNKRAYLSIEEIQTLSDTQISNTQVKLAFIFACFTGLRISDILKLTWQNIQNDSISIHQEKTQELLIFPLTEPAKQILQVLPKNDERVFHLIHTVSINKSLKRWAARAGIEKNVSFHTARHSFAVNYLSLGGDIFVLKELLGHTLLETTLVYADIISERKIQAAKLFPKINI